MSGYKYNINNVRAIKSEFDELVDKYLKESKNLGFMFNHSEFLKEWILRNESNFDDFDEIIDLIKLTEKYDFAKLGNNILDFFNGDGTLDKNKTLSEIIDRNLKRMGKIKEDLENLTIHASKTKLLLEVVNDFISNPTNYIPKKDKRINNVEELE